MTYTVKIGTNRVGDNGTTNDNEQQIELDANLGLSPIQTAAISAAFANRISREKARFDDLQRELDEIKQARNLEAMDRAIANTKQAPPFGRTVRTGPIHERLMDCSDSEMGTIISRLSEAEVAGALGRIFSKTDGRMANQLGLRNKARYVALRDLARRYGVVC